MSELIARAKTVIKTVGKSGESLDITINKGGDMIDGLNTMLQVAGVDLSVSANASDSDCWIIVGEHPKCSGRYTVHSSYGVRDAFFSESFISGDFRWQDCETGNDEGVENHDGIGFEVYNWMPLPKPPKAAK